MNAEDNWLIADLAKDYGLREARQIVKRLRAREAKYGKLTIELVLSVPNEQGPYANVFEYFSKPKAWLKRKKAAGL